MHARSVLILASLFCTPALADLGFTSPGVRPAMGTQDRVRLVTSGNVTFAMWSDDHFSSQHVVISRLDAQGVAIDAPGLTLPGVITSPDDAAIANCGGHVIAVWRRQTPLGCERLVTAEVLVGPTGLTLGSIGTLPPPSLAASAQTGVQLASGPECFLAWFNGGAHLGTRFTTTALDSPPLAVTPPSTARVVFDGTQFIWVWTEGIAKEVKLARMTSAGVFSPTISLAATSGGASVAVNGGVTLVTWWTGGDVQAQWLDATGASVAGPTVIAQGVGGLQDLAATDFGAGFAVAGINTVTPARVYVIRLDATGNVATALTNVPLTVDAKRVRDVALSSRGTGLVAAFSQDPRPVDGPDVHAAVLGPTLQPVAMERIVSLAAPAQRRHFVTALDTTALVGWTDERWEDRGTPYSYVQTAFAGRIAADGAVLDAAGIQLSTGANANEVIGVSADTDHFLAAWTEGPINRVWVRTIDQRTGTAGPARQVLSGFVGAAFAGWPGNHLVIGVDVTRSAVAQRVDAQGNTVGAAVTLPNMFSWLGGSKLVLASNGSGWLLARTFGATLYLLPIDSNGQPGTVVTRNWGNVVAEFDPSTAWNGTEWLVSWRSQTSSCAMNLERFDASLSSLAPATVSSSCIDDGMGLAFDGTNWITVQRNRLFDQTLQRARGLDVWPLNSTLQSPDGGMPEVIQEDDLDHPNRSPALAALPQGRVLIVYDRRLDEAPFGTWRVRAKVWPSVLVLPDAGIDAGSDAGFDAGLADAGFDAGLADAGFEDAGFNDAGLDDAGLDDAAFNDAGLGDGGQPFDAGAEPQVDGGTQPSGAPSGCGCAAADLTPLLFGLLLLARGRRRSDQL